jgi:ectonucleotide pyrophosphatase/phosphodiesterase family member 5
MKKLFFTLILLFTGIFRPLLYSENNIPYVILISFNGFRYDFNNTDTLNNFNFIKENGVSAFSLKPVFPTTSLPNQYSAITGMYADNHGIIANSFKNPFNNNYFSINFIASLKEDNWYNGEPFWTTAKRNGINTGTCFWAGSETDNQNKRPDYYLESDNKYNYLQRIDKAVEWLNKEYSERPHFIALDFEEIDLTTHRFGIGSLELSYSLGITDSILGYLFEKLRSINLFDSTNIIIISDHGIMDFNGSNTINIDSLLTGMNYEIQNYGAFMMINAEKKVQYKIYNKLKEKCHYYRVFLKKEIPASLHYSRHPFISPILIIADPGYVLTDSISETKINNIKAINGYDNNELNMHGIFYAMGPGFKKNYKTSTLKIIEIYPLLCKLFNITPRYNIDGKLDCINHILKDE